MSLGQSRNLEQRVMKGNRSEPSAYRRVGLDVHSRAPPSERPEGRFALWGAGDPAERSEQPVRVVDLVEVTVHSDGQFTHRERVILHAQQSHRPATLYGDLPSMGIRAVVVAGTAHYL